MSQPETEQASSFKITTLRLCHICHMIVTDQIVTFVAVHAFKCKYSKAFHVHSLELVWAQLESALRKMKKLKSLKLERTEGSWKKWGIPTEQLPIFNGYFPTAVLTL